MMMWIRPDFQIPAGIDGRTFVGYVFGIGVVVMFAYKYYTDIYKKRRRDDWLAELLEMSFLQNQLGPAFPLRVWGDAF